MPRDVLLGAFAATVQGLAFIAMRLGLEGFTPPQLAAPRFLIAAVPVIPVPRPAMP